MKNIPPETILIVLDQLSPHLRREEIVDIVLDLFDVFVEEKSIYDAMFFGEVFADKIFEYIDSLNMSGQKSKLLVIDNLLRLHHLLDRLFRRWIEEGCPLVQYESFATNLVAYIGAYSSAYRLLAWFTNYLNLDPMEKRKELKSTVHPGKLLEAFYQANGFEAFLKVVKHAVYKEKSSTPDLLLYFLVRLLREELYRIQYGGEETFYYKEEIYDIASVLAKTREFKVYFLDKGDIVLQDTLAKEPDYELIPYNTPLKEKIIKVEDALHRRAPNLGRTAIIPYTARLIAFLSEIYEIEYLKKRINNILKSNTHK